jgi:Lrp/AsnC family leucine-responsive transcriptional regulator
VLGATVHLSASQISRRLQRLAEAGIIAGHAALLDPAAIGLGVTAFAHVILERHGKSQSDAFEAPSRHCPKSWTAIRSAAMPTTCCASSPRTCRRFPN